MLHGLSIRDVVLIDSLDLEIGPGFTALTGETGAGKSIVLDALGLALGERGDKGLVRAGADRAIAMATFLVGKDHPACEFLEELGMEPPEDGFLVLRRMIGADGKSRAFVNDAPVTAKTLAAIGNLLLEVHGQHASTGLLQAANHRTLLDAFAANHAERSAVTDKWSSLTAARRMLQDLLDRRERAERDREYMTHVLGELERLDPKPGEEEALDGERRFLMSTEKLVDAVQDALTTLGEGGTASVEGRLSSAARAMERAAKLMSDGATQSLTSALLAASDAIERALTEATEARAQIEAAGRMIDAEPGRAEKVEERLFALRAAARKHNVPVDQLPGLRAQLHADVTALENLDADITNAERAVNAAEADYERAATALSRTRTEAAGRLDAAVMAELTPLKLERARFRTSVEPQPDKGSGEGWDRVAFEVSTNPGTPFGPLASIASGGELARFSLALKVALASAGSVATLVFDEVDQGVGGATADAVGRRMRALAQSAQILCVTHSPQVAARADAHWRIAKADTATGATRTSVEVLSPAEREEELARMLSGATITEEARAAARILVGA